MSFSVDIQDLEVVALGVALGVALVVPLMTIFSKVEEGDSPLRLAQVRPPLVVAGGLANQCPLRQL